VWENDKMRVESLTIFRFIAALIVVVFHFGRNTELAQFAFPFLISGPQMVTFFFALSGFVMMISHYNRKDESLRNYYVARIARIAPLYFVALFLMVYFVINDFGTGRNNLTGLLLSATFLQSWFSPYPLSFNDPAWSLSVEALFYLCFPLILFIVKKSHISPVKFALMALVVYIFTQLLLSNWMPEQLNYEYKKASFDIIYYFPMSHFCSFLLGVAGGYLHCSYPERFNRKGLLSFMIMLIVMYITYYLLQYPYQIRQFFGHPVAYESSFYGLMFIVFILAVAQSNNILTKVLSMRFLVLLGESSYALYILQKPMHIVYKKYIATHIDISQNNHFYLYLSLLIILSILSFYVIEKPAKTMIIKFNKALLKRKV
jgi:peptidoglycan/LPS O-acetylase OafA/YrhL